MVITLPLRRIPGVLTTLLCFVLGQLCFALPLRIGGVALAAPGIGFYALGLAIALRSFRHAGLHEYPALWEPSRRAQWLCVIGLALVAGGLRFAWLATLPGRVDGDAAAFALSAAEFLKPRPPSLIGTGWQAHTNLYFFLVSLMIRVFGRSALAIRAFSALGGTLGVLAVFALGRSLFDVRTGLLAGFVLTFLPFHLIFSRVGTEVVHLTWLLPPVILLLYEGWLHESPWRWLLGGTIAGLSQYFYPGARLIPIVAVVQIALLAWFPPDGAARNLPQAAHALKWIALGFVLVYAPMIAHYAQYPDTYLARIKLVSITDGWLQEQLEFRPWWRVLGEQVWRAALPFHYPVGGSPLWYLWPQYLQPLDAALLSLGLLLIFVQRSTARWLKLWFTAYIGLAILLGGVMTIDTPMPSRYMILIPAVALAIGRALAELVQRATAGGGHRRELALGAMIGLLLAYAALNVQTYLRHDTQEIWNSDLTNQAATLAARYFQTLPDQNYQILFLEGDAMYYGASPTLPFLTGKTGVNITEPLSCAVLYNNLEPGHAVIIAPRSRVEELEQMQPRLDGSTFVALTNPKGETIAGVLELMSPNGGQAQCRGA